MSTRTSEESTTKLNTIVSTHEIDRGTVHAHNGVDAVAIPLPY